MIKADLKDGMVLEHRNGLRRIVNDVYLLDENLQIYCDLYNYTDELLHKENRDLDVIKVYCNMNIFIGYGTEPLWTRPDEIEEITAEKLNEEFNKYCNTTTCIKCKHNSKNYNPNCKYSWLVDNYNISQK